MSKRGPYAKGQERRDEILRAAVEVISRDGYLGASLSQIGRSIGIDSAHIIYFFPRARCCCRKCCACGTRGMSQSYP